jgi:hypothetical protein
MKECPFSHAQRIQRYFIGELAYSAETPPHPAITPHKEEHERLPPKLYRSCSHTSTSSSRRRPCTYTARERESRREQRVKSREQQKAGREQAESIESRD